jgi:hypothetical protein
MPTDDPPDKADSSFDNSMYVKTVCLKHVISDLKTEFVRLVLLADVRLHPTDLFFFMENRVTCVGYK